MNLLNASFISDLKRKMILNDRYMIISNQECESIIAVNLRTCGSSVMLKTEWEYLQNGYLEAIESKQLIHLLCNEVISLNTTPFQEMQDLHFPRILYWGIADGCNMNCSYCYGSFGINQISYNRNWSDYQKAIELFAKLNVKKIVITGGEPLLNPNVFKIARLIKSKGIRCGILTNGKLINEHNVEEFSIFDYVKISLDSQFEDINDLQRDKGNFQSVCHAIHLLSERNIVIYLGAVITKKNVDKMCSFREWARKKLGVHKIYGSYFIPMGNGYDKEYSCSLEEMRLCDICNLQNEIDNNYNDPVVFENTISHPCVSCGLGMSEAFVDYNFDIYPCRMTYDISYNAGNILSDGIDYILNRLHSINLHCDINHTTCNQCVFKYLCGGGCRGNQKAFTGSIEQNSEIVCKRNIQHLCCAVALKNKYKLEKEYSYDIVPLGE